MIWKYPQEVYEFVRENAPKMWDQELAEECNKALGTNFNASRMKCFRNNHGISGCKKKWSKEEYFRKTTRYPQGMYEYIRDNSWGVSSKEMAERVNEKFGTKFSTSMMKQFRQRHGIKSGVTGWYQKGNAPGNKGKKLEEYVKDPGRLEEIRARMAPTQFKKGDRPSNELPVGSIVVNSDGYKLRKKSMTGGQWERWEPLHRAVWEEHHGPIPNGKVVTFKDGNKLNCSIDNLMLVTRSEIQVMINKGYRRFEDPELTEAAFNLVRLQLAANKKKKESRRNQS